MGNASSAAALDAVDSNLTRLVVLSPYFLDLTEVQVAPFRASGVAHAPSTDGSFPGDPYDQISQGNCTYSSSALGKEDWPVNCISWQTAHEYCLKIGKDLPSEAQWEYAASARRSATFPWGEDPPSCSDAFFAKAGNPISPDECLPRAYSPGPVGQSVRDRIAFTTAGPEIVDLAGNAREWALDAFALQASTCWDVPLLHDPVCTNGSSERPIRGGGYHDEPGLMRAATRHSGPIDGEPDLSIQFDPYLDDYGDTHGEIVGFRCARADP
jgi:formylglycine-generating enzyme required for sulfatase activity